MISPLQPVETMLQDFFREKDFTTVMLLIDRKIQDKGTIDAAEQLIYARCLIATRQYTKCLIAVDKFIKEGNNSKDILFAKGLTYFYLKRYTDAYEIFRKEPQWRRWKEKAHMIAEKAVAKVQIGNHTRSFGFIRSVQTEEKLKLVFSIGTFFRKDIRVEFGYNYVDIHAEKPCHSTCTESCELYMPIIPSESSYRFDENGLVLNLRKKEAQLWPNDSIIYKGCEEPIVHFEEHEIGSDADIVEQYRLTQSRMFGTVQEKFDRIQQTPKDDI